MFFCSFSTITGKKGYFENKLGKTKEKNCDFFLLQKDQVKMDWKQVIYLTEML